MNKDLLMPNFIGIGAPRCGTRWMAQSLQEHPEISLPPEEVYYFTTRRVVHSFWRKGLDWYSSLFERYLTPNNKIWGEITPVYLYDDDTPKLIAQCVPQAKIICCLRDQSERAYSWYKFFLRINPEVFTTDFSFERFMTYCPEVYGREGFYLEHLGRYLNYFPRESLLILIYDDLVSNPLSFIQEIYRFLCVNTKFVPPSSEKRINTSRPLEIVRSKKMMRASAYFNRFNLQKLDELFNAINIRKVYEEDFPPRHRLSPRIRSMMASMFSEHNKKLGDMLGRDLSNWNMGKPELPNL